MPGSTSASPSDSSRYLFLPLRICEFSAECAAIAESRSSAREIPGRMDSFPEEGLPSGAWDYFLVRSCEATRRQSLPLVSAWPSPLAEKVFSGIAIQGLFPVLGFLKWAIPGGVSSAVSGLGEVTFGAVAVFSASGAGIAGGASALRCDPQPPKKEIPANPRTAAAVHERFIRMESLRC